MTLNRIVLPNLLEFFAEIRTNSTDALLYLQDESFRIWFFPAQLFFLFHSHFEAIRRIPIISDFSHRIFSHIKKNRKKKNIITLICIQCQWRSGRFTHSTSNCNKCIHSPKIDRRFQWLTHPLRLLIGSLRNTNQHDHEWNCSMWSIFRAIVTQLPAPNCSELPAEIKILHEIEPMGWYWATTSIQMHCTPLTKSQKKIFHFIFKLSKNMPLSSSAATIHIRWLDNGQANWKNMKWKEFHFIDTMKKPNRFIIVRPLLRQQIDRKKWITWNINCKSAANHPCRHN